MCYVYKDREMKYLIMKKLESFFIAGMVILVFAGGYYVGLNETESGKHVLKKSQWEEVKAYQICMRDETCLMYVRVKK